MDAPTTTRDQDQCLADILAERREPNPEQVVLGRQLFEEAAGIGLYRSRREEALRRLDTTRRNLERVQDILAELRPRVRSLKRQVDRSKDYDQVRQRRTPS